MKAYLESKTADEIVQGFWNFTGDPPVSSAFRDGYVIPDNTMAGTIESGIYNKVPTPFFRIYHLPGEGNLQEIEPVFYLPCFLP